MQLVCFLKNQLNSIERLVQKRFPWWDLIVLENLLASAFFDRGDKVFVVPRVHGRTLDGFLPREYGSQLRPHISAKGLRLDRCQNHGHIENPCGLSECHGVVDNSLTVEIACSKQHLALMVDQRHDAIVRSQESLLTQFWTISV